MVKKISTMVDFTSQSPVQVHLLPGLSQILTLNNSREGKTVPETTRERGNRRLGDPKIWWDFAHSCSGSPALICCAGNVLLCLKLLLQAQYL